MDFAAGISAIDRRSFATEATPRNGGFQPSLFDRRKNLPTTVVIVAQSWTTQGLSDHITELDEISASTVRGRGRDSMDVEETTEKGEEKTWKHDSCQLLEIEGYIYLNVGAWY